VNYGGHDYHLQFDSPAIDTGTSTGAPNDDFDGNARPEDGNNDGIAQVDIGAYEFLSSPLDTCLQDDSSGNLLRFSSITGHYQFNNCRGFAISGTGSLIRRGGIITLQDMAQDRRVLARIDTSVGKGAASIQVLSQSTAFAITDRNTTNNTCVCATTQQIRLP
jgi:hypothetical protein